MSFVQRKIDLTFQYGTGDAGLLTPHEVTISGLRVSAQIEMGGGAGLSNLQLKVFGMSPSLMNDLSTVGRWALMFRKNNIIVTAGDDENGMYQVFYGQITMAYADMKDSPDVAFLVTASSGLFEALLPIEPSSYPKEASVPVILKDIVDKINKEENSSLVFENNGVSAVLTNPYFAGSARSQALSVVKAANIEWNGIENGILAIWPRNGYRKYDVPVISSESGMVGYPTFTATGVIVETIFDPVIRFGQLIEVKSQLSAACGRWVVLKLSHNIESIMPNGKWFTQIITRTEGAFT